MRPQGKRYLEGGLALLVGELAGLPLLLGGLWLAALLLLADGVFPDLLVHLPRQSAPHQPLPCHHHSNLTYTLLVGYIQSDYIRVDYEREYYDKPLS